MAAVARAHSDAQGHLSVMQDVAPAMEAERVRLDKALMGTQGTASLPILHHGVRARLAAAERLDAVRIELAAAEAGYDRADAIITYAMTKGASPSRNEVPIHPAPEIVFQHARPHRNSAAEESEIWQRNGLDLSDPAGGAA